MPDIIPSLHAQIASAYIRDANDFLSRFENLKEDYSKTKRMKSFVDLLMGFECALKAHIFLSPPYVSAEETYKAIRRVGHNINTLSSIPCFVPDKVVYQKSASILGNFSVFLRYSLDGYESFFPSGIAQEEASASFSATLANPIWLNEVVALLQELIDPTIEPLSGHVDFDNFLESEIEMRNFVLAVGIARA